MHRKNTPFHNHTPTSRFQHNRFRAGFLFPPSSGGILPVSPMAKCRSEVPPHKFQVSSGWHWRRQPVASNRENWPLYRQELARLEAEQEVCERRKRHEGETGFFNWKAENVDCATPYSDRLRGLRLVLIGPPGAGRAGRCALRMA